MAQINDLLVLGKSNFLGEVNASSLLSAKGGIALSNTTAESTALQYVLGIKAFAEGGNVMWSSISNFANQVRLNASGNWAINISGTAAKATADASGNTITSTYLKLSGGTMTGPITMNVGTGLQMKYEAGKDTVWMYPNGASTYGIRYLEGTPDKMMISASGNNSTATGADLCINGNGDGTVTIRGNTILHAGNFTSYTVTKTGSGASGTWGITSAYAQKMETWYLDKSKTYGSQYPLYAWWETGSVCKLTVDSYQTKVDQAAKLSTARTINGTSFNGEANITTAKWGTARNIYIADYYGANTGAAVSVDGNENETLKLPQNLKVGTINTNLAAARAYSSDKSKYYHKIATLTQSVASSQINTALTFLVSGYYSSAKRWNGLLKAEVRWEAAGTAPGYAELKWIACDSNIVPGNYYLTYSISSNTVTLNIYTYIASSWHSINFTKLSEHNWGSSVNQFGWTLLEAVAPTNCVTAIPTTETKVVSTVNPIYINTVSNTWANGTASAGPSLYTTVNGVSGTAVRMPVATNALCGATKVYKASDCTEYTDDVYALTPAAVKKAFGLFNAVSSSALVGGTKLTASTIDSFLSGNLIKWAPAEAGAVGWNNDGMIVSFGWSSAYGAQLWLDDGGSEGGMRLRNRSSSGWNPWRAVLTSYGGSLDDGKQLTRIGKSSSWYNGRDNAMIRQTTISGYSPIMSIKSTNGTWEMGCYDNSNYLDRLIIGYKADSEYNAGTPNSIVQAFNLTKAGYLYLASGFSAGGNSVINNGTLTFTHSTVASQKITTSSGEMHYASASTIYIDSGSGSSLIFRPQGAEQARFNTSGQLQIKSTGAANATVIGPGTAGTFYFPNTGGTFVTHATRGTAVGSATRPVYIATTGRATACNAPASGAWFSTVPSVGSDGVMEIGRYIDFHYTSASTNDFDVRIDCAGNSKNTLYLPAVTGQVVVHTNDTAIGSATLPVYVAASGAVTACTASSVFSTLSWTGGTSSGPVLNVTVAGQARTATIPSASSSASGIVTTGSQTLAGTKTFSSGIVGKSNLWLQKAGLTKGTAPSESTGSYISFVDGAGTAAANRIGMIYSYVDSSNVSHMRIYAYKPVSGATDTSYLDLTYSNGGTTYANYSGGYLQVKRLIATATTDAAYGSANNVALITGDASGTHLEFDGNEIFAKTSGTAAGTLYLQSGSGTTEISSLATFKNDAAGGFNFAGRIDVGCLLLTNTSWTGYGTSDPNGNLTAVKGRVYFKLI